MSPPGWEEIWSALETRTRFGMLSGLERMEALLERLGHPERELRCIQLAGTNGKGATAYALWRMLEASGEPAGLFVSPHLLHPSERIRLRGAPLDEESAQRAWRELEPHLDELGASYFETLTALALLAFAQAGLDRVVLECGLGGRLDATSAARPCLSLLTSVGADHLERLGPTLADVARDKAQVAPPGGWLLSAVEQPELREVVAGVARQRNSRVRQLEAVPPVAGEGWLEDRVWLRGRSGHTLLLPEDTRAWRSAAGLALACAEQLDLPPLPEEAPPVRLEASHWPGRFQVLRREPPLVLDVAHNPPALEWLVRELQSRWPGRRFHLLMAGMEDKALADNLRALAPLALDLQVFVPRAHRRAAGLERWREEALGAGLELAGWVDEESLPDLRRKVEGLEESEAWLVTGSFLGVAAWLGAGTLPPGL